ncbi:hypothetical protein ACFWXA_29390 [Streptomyces atroolivaceus]|uniref:hypothetical protein n=1 Tax=Streptomyces atroolivaceus TaxID=66869 RepID=UPI0036601169
MKRLTAVLSASALALGGLAGASMLAPVAAHAEPTCGGSIDDWRSFDGAASYSGTGTTSFGSTLERKVVLEGDTAWVPGETDKLPFTFTPGKVAWGVSSDSGGTNYSLSAPQCAQGDSRVTSATYEEFSGGVGGGGRLAGQFTRA